MNLHEIHNTDLEPYHLEDKQLQSIALKNYTLFSKINEETKVIIAKKYLAISLDFISKQDFDEYELIILDEDSFDRLYNRFLEAKADVELQGIGQDEELNSEGEDELSLAEFLQTSADILTSSDSAPIIKFVNSLFYQAMKKNASDIHIELHEYKGEVRFRIDGVLTKHTDLDKKIVSLVISRIKVISNLDISEKRIPQDGRTAVKIAKESLDVRVSVLPTYYGERIVMRLLMQSENIPSISQLGYDDKTVEELNSLVQHSHGIILVTGPTGSGKSTTLHSLLQEIVTPEKNIITIEDPVEYKSDDINQIQVNEKVGLTFASGLRSILRQDPDIVMLGEVRDTETAKIAIQAALTGHLVFSTLHTNTATASISRLIDMGVEKFLITASVLGVLAQRLVRVLCDECKIEDSIAEEFADEFDLPKNAKIYKQKGCNKCNYTGFTKRKAVAELFLIDNHIRELIKKSVSDVTLREEAIKSNKAPLVPISSTLKKMLLDGKTSLDEAIRVGLKEE
jgi:general secretion pathway protein E